MKVYKLVKTYPDSPLLNTIIYSEKSEYINEYWLDITWNKDLENSVGKWVSLKKYNSHDKAIYVLVDNVIITDLLYVVSKGIKYSVADYIIKIEDTLLSSINMLPKIGDFYMDRNVDKRYSVIIPLEILKIKDNFNIVFYIYHVENLQFGNSVNDYISNDNKFNNISYSQVITCSLDTFNNHYMLAQDNKINTIINV